MMMTLPLAVYTAQHGLAWTYPQSEIDFSELDACRKAFGRLPDFDAGEAGYEGVWVTETRVFVARCQSVHAWDFRGRDATYLTVAWLPRHEAQHVDFEALLRHPTLCEPNRTPRSFFDINFPPCANGAAWQTLPAQLSDGFRSVHALIAQLPETFDAILKRPLNETVVNCHYSERMMKQPLPLKSFEHADTYRQHEPVAQAPLAHVNSTLSSTKDPVARMFAVIALVVSLLALLMCSCHRLKSPKSDLDKILKDEPHTIEKTEKKEVPVAPLKEENVSKTNETPAPSDTDTSENPADIGQTKTPTSTTHEVKNVEDEKEINAETASEHSDQERDRPGFLSKLLALLKRITKKP